MSLPERHNAAAGADERNGNGEGIFARLKAMLRRGSGSLRSDLEEVLDPVKRVTELRNFLEMRVKPQASVRGRA